MSGAVGPSFVRPARSHRFTCVRVCVCVDVVLKAKIKLLETGGIRRRREREKERGRKSGCARSAVSAGRYKQARSSRVTCPLARSLGCLPRASYLSSCPADGQLLITLCFPFPPPSSLKTALTAVTSFSRTYIRRRICTRAISVR